MRRVAAEPNLYAGSPRSWSCMPGRRRAGPVRRVAAESVLYAELGYAWGEVALGIIYVEVG